MELEIENRNNLPKNDSVSTRVYSEPEIWYIIELLTSITHSFQQRGYHHGDIQPKNLMIDQHGFIKLIDTSLINYGETGYSKMIFGKKYTAALSPKLMESLPYGEIKPLDDKVKSDMFSIGITSLCAALNCNKDQFYDWKKPAIKFDSIKRGLNQMVDLGFSKQLVNTIDGLLNPNETARTSNEQMFDFLARNQHAIATGNFHDITTMRRNKDILGRSSIGLEQSMNVSGSYNPQQDYNQGGRRESYGQQSNQQGRGSYGNSQTTQNQYLQPTGHIPNQNNNQNFQGNFQSNQNTFNRQQPSFQNQQPSFQGQQRTFQTQQQPGFQGQPISQGAAAYRTSGSSYIQPTQVVSQYQPGPSTQGANPLMGRVN